MLTVVLDLDNTLVFTRVLDADSATVLVTLRPYLFDLLHLALTHCEVFVWTAGRRHYASHAVQRMLDYFKLPRVPYLITRDDEGWYNEYETFKDVQLLGRDMDSVLLVEDSVPYARVSCDNCVIVPSYRGEPSDTVLRNLTQLLRQMIACRGGLGVPQFLRENVQSPLFVPSPYVISAYGSTCWNSMQQQQRVLQPNLPALAAIPNASEITAEYAAEGTAPSYDVVDVPPPSPKRRQMSMKNFKNQKVRQPNGRKRAAAIATAAPSLEYGQ